LTNLSTQNLRFLASERGDEVSALLLQPENARALLVLAHGAGAGMRHKFMDDISQKLASQGVSTLRYQFPYTEKKIKRPDPEAVLIAGIMAKKCWSIYKKVIW
jgi:predicted alpha/beta-hydrolase family hydrolase